jgi:hypothetical protein
MQKWQKGKKWLEIRLCGVSDKTKNRPQGAIFVVSKFVLGYGGELLEESNTLWQYT